MRKFYNSIPLKLDHIQKLSDDLFRIKITPQLRSYGVLDILLDRNNFEITSNHFNVFVKHHGDTGTIVESTEDQLLDPKCELPSYIANKIINYIFSVAEEMAFIIEYFEWTVIQR